MWTTEHRIETAAAPERIWALWADVTGWPEWNHDLERAELSGPFTEGSTITMYSAGQDPIVLTIAHAAEPEGFVDQVDLGPVVVRTLHLVERSDGGGSRLTYRMEITGPEADALGPEIGPQISSDFPEVLRSLAGRAVA
jgi:Polyketide cyclase / dehydrase and lipid transport